MLTSDPRIEMGARTSRGPQYNIWYPVKMPTPSRYIEAMFRLLVRDFEGVALSYHWRIEIAYLVEHLIRPERTMKLDDIVEPFREWARRLASEPYAQRKGDPRGNRIECEIFVEMARNKQIPRWMMCVSVPGSHWTNSCGSTISPVSQIGRPWRRGRSTGTGHRAGGGVDCF